jgi:DNA-binding transcriptional LysR family regulator
VSQQISSLERQFKSILIERSKKKFRLTREGQVLYEYSKQIIQTYQSLQSKLQEIKDVISGTIRVATIYSIGLHDLPPYLKKYLKSYPTVNVHVEYRRSNQVYEDVLSNVVDLGLVAYPVRDNKLDVVRSAGIDSSWFVTRNTRWRSQNPFPWPQLPVRNLSVSNRISRRAKPSIKFSRTAGSRFST